MALVDITCGRSIVEALPSCENMSWSLLTRGMTDCPKTAAGAGGGEGVMPDGDPGTVDDGGVPVGCDMVRQATLLSIFLHFLFFSCLLLGSHCPTHHESPHATKPGNMESLNVSLEFQRSKIGLLIIILWRLIQL